MMRASSDRVRASLSAPAWMRIVLLGLTLGGAVWLCSGCGERGSVKRPATVKVAIQPEYSLAVMMNRYGPLIARMQETLGPRYRIEWISCASPEAYIATIERERPILSIQDAYTTALLMKLQDARPVLQEIDLGRAPLARGVVIVPAEGEPIASLEGERIAISSRRSFLGFLAQAREMEGGGMDPATCTFVPLHWQDEVVKQVREGKIHAGLVSEDAIGPGVRVIARTRPVPSACAVIYPYTPPEMGVELISTLAGLIPQDPGDAPVLAKLRIAGFRPVDNAAAERVRALAASPQVPY